VQVHGVFGQDDRPGPVLYCQPVDALWSIQEPLHGRIDLNCPRSADEHTRDFRAAKAFNTNTANAQDRGMPSASRQAYEIFHGFLCTK
jgi:hypothetical protein